MSSFVMLVAIASAGLVGPAPPQTEDALLAVVKSFHDALSSGLRENAVSLLDPEVVIFENGWAEMSRQEYGSHHLSDDIEFSRATSSKVLDQRTGVSGEAGWVLTISETSGTFRGKAVSTRNVETMVMKRTPAGWRIAHIHWSSSPKERPKP